MSIKFNKNNILQKLKLVVLIIVLGFGVNFASAVFVSPTANPPSNNAPAPLNISSNPQSKGGNGLPLGLSLLNINGTFSADNTVSFSNLIGAYLTPTVTGIPSNSYPIGLCSDVNGKVVPCAGGAQTPACSDGVDNDGDTLIDFSGGDPGCSNANDNDEYDVPSTNTIFDVPGQYTFVLPPSVNEIKSIKIWGAGGGAGKSVIGTGGQTFIFGGSGASGCYNELLNYAVAPNQHVFNIYVGAGGGYMTIGNGGGNGQSSTFKKAGFSGSLVSAGGGNGGTEATVTYGVGQGGVGCNGGGSFGMDGSGGTTITSSVYNSVPLMVLHGGKGKYNFGNGGNAGFSPNISRDGDPGRVEINY